MQHTSLYTLTNVCVYETMIKWFNFGRTGVVNDL